MNIITVSPLEGYVTASAYYPTGEPWSYDLTTGGKKTQLFYEYDKVTKRLKRSYAVRVNMPGYGDRDARYHYDDAGNITQIVDTIPSATDPAVPTYDNQCFRYDHQRRLTDAWAQTVPADGEATCASDPATATIGGPAPYRKHYAYTPDGNRTKEQHWGTGVNGGAWRWDRGYSYAGDPGIDTTQYKGHQLAQYTQDPDDGTGQNPQTFTLTYDATGNVTKRVAGNTVQDLTYNPEGQLSLLKETTGSQVKNTTYLYDTDGGRLLSRDSDGGTTLYLPGMELRTNATGTNTKATRYYTHNGQTIAQRTSDGVTFLATDHQGTATLAIDAGNHNLTRRWFSPFGEERATPAGTWPSVTTTRSFVGGIIDQTTSANPNLTLTRLGARDYDPNTGRFITVDPLFDPADPQSWNGYAYANNSPVTMADPDGLRTVLCNGVYVDERKCNPDPDGTMRPDGDAEIYDYYDPYSPANLTGPAREQRKIVERRKVVDTLVQAKLPGELVHAKQLKKGFCAHFPEESSLCADFTPGKSQPHTALAGCGMLPYVGVICDVADVGLYIKEGNWQAALMAGIFVIPIGGDLLKGGKLLKGAGKACKKSSFVPGTEVLMADGSKKPIEDLQVGDEVIATDPETGETGAKKVLATITSQGQKNLVEVTVDTDGPHGDDTGLIIATDEHPFWVAGLIQRWTDAEDLRPGMWLRTSAGTYLQVKATHARTTPHQRVYNLTIADTHTYYVWVGGSTVLVHNDHDEIDPRFVIPDWNPGDGSDDDGYHTPRDNQKQNRQARDAIKEAERNIGRSLTRAEKRQVHDAITKRGLDYDGIVNEVTQMFGC